MTRFRFSGFLFALFAAVGVVGCSSPEPLVISELSLEKNPNERVPLAAICRITTDRPSMARIDWTDGEEKWSTRARGSYKLEHEVMMLGFRPGKTHTVRVTVVDEEGLETVSDPLRFTTDPLPDDFPPIDLRISRPRKMEPGVTLIPTVKWPGLGEPDRTFGLILGVDDHGEVVWYYHSDHNIMALERLRNGNILYHYGRKGNIAEIDMLGNVVRHWHAKRLLKDQPPGSIQIDTDTIHHDVQELPSGNLLALSTEVRYYRNYPSSETDRDAPWGEAYVIGDVVLEIDRDGAVLNRWPLLDLLDPYRIGYDSLDTGFWSDVYTEQLLGKKAYDWSHANSVAYDARDHSVLVSVFHQDTVFKFSMDTGEVEWIISFPTGWREDWMQYLLTPVGEGLFPCHEHAAKVTPRGTILMYDNGTYRARPFDQKREARDNYSRAVEYEVNTETMEFREVWSYGGPEDEIFFSPFLSDADWMPQTENILITDGGRVRAADGSNANHPAHGRKWARILEVTHEQPAEKVFEIVIDDPGMGWTVYRSERIPSLYPW